MKKRNYYNLIVYVFKGSAVMGLICLVFMCLSNDNLIPKVCLIMMFICFGIVLFTMFLMGKYESKITTYIDKPKPPYTYCVKEIDFEKLDNNFMEVDKRYKKVSYEDIDNAIYYKQARKFYLDPSRQVTVFAFYNFDTFNQDTKKYLVRQRQIISKK